MSKNYNIKNTHKDEFKVDIKKKLHTQCLRITDSLYLYIRLCISVACVVEFTKPYIIYGLTYYGCRTMNL